jgi:pimeloyl-ACP methyl ester carboxylesterase
MTEHRLKGIAGLVMLLGAVGGSACASPAQEYPVRHSTPHRYMVDGRNYTFAVYDSSNHLISHPIEDLRWQLRHSEEGITDVYVVSHGWNYTVPEAMANYYKYVDLVDERTDPELRESFRPYVIFVVWPSVIRPMRDAARSVLPFQLDRVVAPLTKKADDWIFRLPTNWKQSLDAYSLALGERSPVLYREQAYDEVRAVGTVDSPEISRDLPVSGLIHELIQMRGRGVLGTAHSRIHLIGHSYGGKLVALAGIEALRRSAAEAGSDPGEIPQDLIESMILISPAFHPRELLYVSSFESNTGRPSMVSREEIESALRSVPRKAVVYSRYDHVNGPIFAVSQLLLNNHQAQIANATMNNLTGTIEASDGAISHASLVVRPVGGIAQTGWNIGTAPLQAGAGALTNLVPDFLHHVRESDSSEAREGRPTDWMRPGMNAVHFFMPLDELVEPRSDPDRLGIFRMSSPAIGSTGLSHLATGRPDLGVQIHPELDAFDNLGPLDTLAPPDAQRDAAAFVQLARAAGSTGQAPPIRREMILSFDASSIYNRWDLPKGAHTDLGSHTAVDVGYGPLEKREYTYNFLFNFTLCLPTEGRHPREGCMAGRRQDDTADQRIAAAASLRSRPPAPAP